MADFSSTIHRLLTDSVAVYVRPGATVEIFTAGTASLIWTGTTDVNGVFSVPTLATGHYDVKVDGALVHSFHHVKSDHSHGAVESLLFFRSGAITANEDENATMLIQAPGVAGTIKKIVLTAEATDSSGDITVHLLQGSQGGGAILTVASDSIWQKRINPGTGEYRWTHTDTNPGLTMTASQVLTMGIDHTVNGVSCVCLRVVFRPD